MSFVRKWWNSVFVKFSAAFLLVGLVPLIALSIFSLQAFTGHVQQFTVNNLKQMSLYLSYNVNNFFSDYDDITRLMYTGRYEGYSHTISVNQTANVNEYEQINSIPIAAFLRTVLYSDKHIRSVYFVRSLDGKLYFQTRQSKPLLEEKLPVAEWLQPLAEKPNHLSIYPTHGEHYYNSPDRRVITFGRNLIDISGTLTAEPKVVGSLFIDVDAGVLDSFFQEMNLNKDDELYVLDGANRIYYSNRTDREKASEEAAETAPERFDDEDYLVFSDEIPYLSGQVLMRVSERSLFAQLTSTQSAVYLAIVVCAIALLAMGTLLSRRLASPIRDVLQHMNKVEMGNLDTQIESYGKDELGRLAFGFNRMVERLKIFINDAYVAEIKQKQAELNALKSQIRPHYLYNTLEVIRMNAVYNDDGEVADMILALSNQLKYVIDYGEDWVTVREEIDHLNDYFHIIRVRYENRIDLRLNVADDVRMDFPILKLSLQPIVENAIQHGIRPKGGKGSVLVTMERAGDTLSVTVYDDGVGMSETQLQRLKDQLAETKAPSKNVGLKNVCDRIKTVCGDGYGLEISSMEHVGTSVRLSFPVRKI
ncbi:two-component sensor histidine kinase [Cohnella sp. CIP 111063]|uniref:cache domain-containing sensor histidine kinase n=1 Tax=unclassified Cohnella TaxID=2636738 RepID=UPI000B8C48C9|nr:MULTISPECIES: sensor histidine kinase [unclassified Cohnella]OXS52663.1 two-component sensor histidine kinase [Cohnella sp. CIP 111063]PRX59194.1 two-component system sensor histidine kinase YesM [Cohnella sp. SGD-V74]